VSRHPNGGLMVMFGTGQYIQTADVASTATQSLYGIWDNGAVVASRANLQVQTVASQRTTSGVNYRVVSNTAMVWGTKKGWFIDLPAAGERVIVDPILRFGRFIVPTTVPAADPCASGGYSWLMELDYLSGGRLNKAIFDENQDGIVNAADLGGPLYASGQQIDAIASSPAVVTGFGTDENKYLNESSGAIARVREAGDPLANRRSSWRQIQ
jgi:type IV pilus assembly protein PilY1